MQSTINKTQSSQRIAHAKLGITLDAHKQDPLHSQLTQQLRSIIDTDYNDGSPFFTEKELVTSLSVSRVTVRRALDDLRRDGLIRRHVGQGSVVVKPGPRIHFNPEVKDAGKASAITTLLPNPESPYEITSIGLVVSDYQSDHFREFMDAFTVECAARSLPLDVISAHFSNGIELAFSKIESATRNVGYVTLVSSDQTQEAFSRLSMRGLRSIAVDGAPSGYLGPLVTTDSRSAVRLALEHLWSLGHERIGLLVNEPMEGTSIVTKVVEFAVAMRERGLARHLRIVICGTSLGHSSYDAAYRCMDEMWAGPQSERPTALFAVSDAGAWAALKWFHERSISVPSDISVMGFEDARPSAYVTPPLTTLAHPRTLLASTIIELLISGKDLTGIREYIPPTLVLRASTGPPP